MARNATIDAELQLGKSATTFGCLINHVWRNHHLSVRTEVKEYDAFVLSILLYGAETWLIYRPQESRLSSFHARHTIIGKTWENKMTNDELFKIPNLKLLSSRLKLIGLRWAGHVTKCQTQQFYTSYYMVKDDPNSDVPSLDLKM